MKVGSDIGGGGGGYRGEGEVWGGLTRKKWPGGRWGGWIDERCFRPLLCTVKAELGRGKGGGGGGGSILDPDVLTYQSHYTLITDNGGFSCIFMTGTI